MPLALVGGTKDAVVSVPVSMNWQAGVERFLLAVSGDRGRIERHLAILEDRLQGRLPWAEILAGATLSDGRPMPASRRYAEMLVAEDRLPLYDVGPLRVSLDLHNPGNEAGVPEYDADQLELAIVAGAGYFALAPRSVFPAQPGFEDLARRRAAHGELLGELVARLFEATQATFAYADVGATGWVVSTSQRPSSVVRPAPAGVRPQDFLWSISVWSRDLLAGRVGERPASPRLLNLELSYSECHWMATFFSLVRLLGWLGRGLDIVQEGNGIIAGGYPVSTLELAGIERVERGERVACPNVRRLLPLEE